MTRRAPETFTCPNCGADVPASAAACPECGSDEATGWSEDAAYDDLDLPLTPEEQDQLDQRQPSTAMRQSPHSMMLAAVILMIVCILALLTMGI